MKNLRAYFIIAIFIFTQNLTGMGGQYYGIGGRYTLEQVKSLCKNLEYSSYDRFTILKTRHLLGDTKYFISDPKKTGYLYVGTTIEAAIKECHYLLSSK